MLGKRFFQFIKPRQVIAIPTTANHPFSLHLDDGFLGLGDGLIKLCADRGGVGVSEAGHAVRGEHSRKILPLLQISGFLHLIAEVRHRGIIELNRRFAGQLWSLQGGGRGRTQRNELKAFYHHLRFIAVRGRQPVLQPEIEPHIFVAGLRHGRRIGKGPGGKHIGRRWCCRITAGQCLEADAVGHPGEQVRGIRHARRHAVADQVAGLIVRLHHELRVVGVGRAAPAGTFHVNLAISECRIVAPGEESQRDIRVEAVRRRAQLKPVVTLAESPG